MKLTKSQRTKIIKKLLEAHELEKELLYDLLLNGFKGFKNYSDKELLEAYSYINPEKQEDS